MRWGADISHTPRSFPGTWLLLPPAFWANLSPTYCDCPGSPDKSHTSEVKETDAGQSAQMEGASSVGEALGGRNRGRCGGPMCGPELQAPLSRSSRFSPVVRPELLQGPPFLSFTHLPPPVHPVPPPHWLLLLLLPQQPTLSHSSHLLDCFTSL